MRKLKKLKKIYKIQWILMQLKLNINLDVDSIEKVIFQSNILSV